jgi:hypothetical protein
MRHLNIVLFTALILTSSFAQAQTTGSTATAFQPMIQSTKNFKIWADSEFRTGIQNHADECYVSTLLNAEDQVIELKMGVKGSDFELFGYGMNIPLADFPLKAGYTKTFSDPGLPTMKLTYDGTKLKFFFAKEKDEELFTRLYPFTVGINPTLTQVTSLEASMEGYETTFGIPKKHVTEKCKF